MLSTCLQQTGDNQEIYRFAIEETGVSPIVALNPRGRTKAITSSLLYLTGDGSYICFAGFKVMYWGREDKRERLKFRCPQALGKCCCLFRSQYAQSSYC